MCGVDNTHTTHTHIYKVYQHKFAETRTRFGNNNYTMYILCNKHAAYVYVQMVYETLTLYKMYN